MTQEPSPTTIEYRLLQAAEIERVDEIDRSEVIDGRYRLRNAALVLDEDHHFVVRGWQPASLDANKHRMRECLARGGAGWGAFAGERLVGIAVLDGRRIGSALDALDMYFLHVSDGYRGRGIGRELVRFVRQRAREMGALRLYVSAAQTRNTVTFYQGVGFGLASEVDAKLYELEPDDIHMDMQL
jgi:predicted N-acetyltransferase YhbS